MESRFPKGFRRVARAVYAHDARRELLVRPAESTPGRGIEEMGDDRLKQLVESLHRHTFHDPLAVAVEVEEVWGLPVEEVDRGQ